MEGRAAPYLEFTIKSYRDHDGVTNQLGKLEWGNELIIRDVWGAVEYKGPGYFIAGGAGITPFVAILRQLHKDGQLAGNTLFFSNKTSADIILREELGGMLGGNAWFILTQEKTSTPVAGKSGAAPGKTAAAPEGDASSRNTASQPGDGPHLLTGYLDKEFFQGHVQDFSRKFYLCGPDKMISSLQQTLTSLGASTDSVVFEK